MLPDIFPEQPIWFTFWLTTFACCCGFGLQFWLAYLHDVTMCVFCFVKEDVLAPPPENDDVVNDFDIEEEVIEVENRFVMILCRSKTDLWKDEREYIYICV